MGILSRAGGADAVSTDTLNQHELTLLIKILHDCKFDGKDVLLLADIVVKLQNQLKAK